MNLFLLFIFYTILHIDHRTKFLNISFLSSFGRYSSNLLFHFTVSLFTRKDPNPIFLVNTFEFYYNLDQTVIN